MSTASTCPSSPSWWPTAARTRRWPRRLGRTGWSTRTWRPWRPPCAASTRPSPASTAPASTATTSRATSTRPTSRSCATGEGTPRCRPPTRLSPGAAQPLTRIKILCRRTEQKGKTLWRSSVLRRPPLLPHRRLLRMRWKPSRWAAMAWAQCQRRAGVVTAPPHRGAGESQEQTKMEMIMFQVKTSRRLVIVCLGGCRHQM
mmetsp:Transcript_11686/g.20367  ORF Transcript_11686/g.20367 Transcript_11686/m.20367 type:complete len:201 (+) Transcript_11686:246-848(+)